MSCSSASRSPTSRAVPEAALSPQRQLALLKLMHELVDEKGSQFIVATHSPIVLAYPDAVIFSLDGDAGPQVVRHEDTEHYRLTRDFLLDRERYLSRLFGWGGAEEAAGSSGYLEGRRARNVETCSAPDSVLRCPKSRGRNVDSGIRRSENSARVPPTPPPRPPHAPPRLGAAHSGRVTGTRMAGPRGHIASGRPFGAPRGRR